MIKITEADFQQAAKRLNLKVSRIKAIAEVEATGEGFLSTGQIKILYERHILYRFMKQSASAIKSSTERMAKLNELTNFIKTQPNLINPISGGYATGATAEARTLKEHERLAAARKINNLYALQSASWGMFQIMGFHWQALGYDSPVDFVLKLSASEGAQLDALCRLILNNTRMLNALRAGDFQTFELLYNGSNANGNTYDSKLAAADKKWSQSD